ncbi:long-chain-fatty-acid--CoA ligase [Marinobacterium nitratireducens]|uniref:Long-chain-fatty-acid--CoA ligase n=1 Tax=Marinobacterium nitratireducens TaxID=518897 RepID=A0A917ZJJ3_9GAMM|nr:fatty acid--CoA ligase [Marinobacterium nitratireducens]GGO84244.1 long-chain-fatty-acid--CoA ligase [Marinobacterium nitratireducens]
MNTKIIEPCDGAYQYPLLIKRLLLSGQRYAPGNEIVCADRRYDYRELNRRIARLANVLRAAGIGPGDTVAVMDWDSHRYLEAYFAVPMIGAVLHHVNVRLSVDQIGYTMAHAEDRLVLVHDDFLPIVEELAGRLPLVRGFIRLSDSDAVADTSLNSLGEYEALLDAASADCDFPDFDENSVATTFYTTGTTGNPKGVFFSHRQLVLHTLNMATTLAAHDGVPLLRSQDVYMPMTPMFHVHAWGVPYVATLLGVKQVYPGRYEPNRLVKLYREEGVTFSHGVPTVLQMVLNCDEAKDTDLGRWKLLTGGAAPTEGLVRQMSERGIGFYTGYGMSETCPLLSLTYLDARQAELPAAEQVALRMRTGVPIPLVDLRIVDEAGREVEPDDRGVGEVQVRAPWLTQGYLREPEKGAELWQGGWLHTGDVASINRDGVLQIRDRIKDVIKTGGEWISSLLLESLISRHPKVANVAVIGVPDARWDERPLALVVPAAGETLDSEMLKRHLAQFVASGEINKWAIPDDIRFVESIPVTSVGKVNKKQIRERIAQSATL